MDCESFENVAIARFSDIEAKLYEVSGKLDALHPESFVELKEALRDMCQALNTDKESVEQCLEQLSLMIREFKGVVSISRGELSEAKRRRKLVEEVSTVLADYLIGGNE